MIWVDHLSDVFIPSFDPPIRRVPMEANKKNMLLGWDLFERVAPNAATTAHRVCRYVQCWIIVYGLDKENTEDVLAVSGATWKWSESQGLNVIVESWALVPEYMEGIIRLIGQEISCQTRALAYFLEKKLIIFYPGLASGKKEHRSAYAKTLIADFKFAHVVDSNGVTQPFQAVIVQHALNWLLWLPMAKNVPSVAAAQPFKFLRRGDQITMNMLTQAVIQVYNVIIGYVIKPSAAASTPAPTASSSIRAETTAELPADRPIRPLPARSASGIDITAGISNASNLRPRHRDIEIAIRQVANDYLHYMDELLWAFSKPMHCYKDQAEEYDDEQPVV